MLRVVADDAAGGELVATSDEICREGARRTLAAASEAEADADVAAVCAETDEAGHRLVVRNGHARPRQVTKRRGRSRSAPLG